MGTMGTMGAVDESSSGSRSTGASTGGAHVTQGSDTSGTDSAPIEECGNGIVEPPEECDDANDALCDGCEHCEIRTSILLDGQRGTMVEVLDVDTQPLKLMSTPFTVEAWMRIDEIGDTADVLRRGSGNAGWRVTLNAEGLVGTVFNGFDHIVDGLNLAGTGWHHVAWTYDLATSRLFLDGELVGTMASVAPVLDPDAPMRIGAWVSNEGVISSHRRGRVDEVRVSSNIRYVSDFVLARRFEPDDATVLLLHFDEGSGMAVADASSWGHMGTATAVAWEPEQGYDQPMFCE
jgi:cysteine-rich repeat protein